jgi:hypothetical protein
LSLFSTFLFLQTKIKNKNKVKKKNKLVFINADCFDVRVVKEEVDELLGITTSILEVESE